jgi:hypothetical protein
MAEGQGWLPIKRSNACRTASSDSLSRAEVASSLPVMAQTPIERATVRQARDGDRPTEDDIAKAKLGPQGVLGSTAPPIFQRRYASAALILQHRLRQILLEQRSMNSTAAHNRCISNGVQ